MIKMIIMMIFVYKKFNWNQKMKLIKNLKKKNKKILKYFKKILFNFKINNNNKQKMNCNKLINK